MQWNLSDDRPIYVQLMETLMQAIASGTLPPGSRLPSVRDLAADAGVNPNTMQRALAELERQGMIYSQRTAGRFVTEEVAQIQGKRKELAMEQIEIFLSAMRDMGYTVEEIIQFIEEVGKGGEK